MKKLIVLILSASLFVFLAACGSKSALAPSPSASSSPVPATPTVEAATPTPVLQEPTLKMTRAAFLEKLDALMSDAGYPTISSVSPQPSTNAGLTAYSYDLNACGLIRLDAYPDTEDLDSVTLIMDHTALSEDEIKLFLYTMLSTVEVFEGDGRTAVYDTLNVQNLTESAITNADTTSCSYMYSVRGNTITLRAKLK